MSRAYTGVGSRSTPVDVLQTMHLMAAWLAAPPRGWTCRSGHADGADQAFESGAGQACESYLPWRGFNGSTSLFVPDLNRARGIAARLHPAWERCGGGARSMMARNVHQVLGWNLDDPSRFVLCWTPDGAERAAECGCGTGGTAMAIRVADENNIPIFNLQRVDWYNRFGAFYACLT